MVIMTLDCKHLVIIHNQMLMVIILQLTILDIMNHKVIIVILSKVDRLWVFFLNNIRLLTGNQIVDEKITREIEILEVVEAEGV